MAGAGPPERGRPADPRDAAAEHGAGARRRVRRPVRHRDAGPAGVLPPRVTRSHTHARAEFSFHESSGS